VPLLKKIQRQKERGRAGAKFGDLSRQLLGAQAEAYATEMLTTLKS